MRTNITYFINKKINIKDNLNKPIEITVERITHCKNNEGVIVNGEVFLTYHDLEDFADIIKKEIELRK